MFPDIISEKEFKVKMCRWLLKNDRIFRIPEDEDFEDYAEHYPVPDFDYVHTQSFEDANGDLITLLKGKIHLKGWETRNGTEPRTFEFYHVLKTLTDTPEVEPFPVGYIVMTLI